MRYGIFMLAAAMLAIGPASVGGCGAPASAATSGFACCKTCRAGKACGDSCISRAKTCHKGKGCACDG